jgi:anthranilate phosphoribosyltransferase
MKHAIGPRRELGVRTIFNVLGPLTNPAGVPNQVLGVFSETLLLPLAEVLRTLGSNHVLVVHSRDGLDEISIADRTDLAELRHDRVERYSVAPEDFGLQRGNLDDIRVDGPEQSLAMLRAVLNNKPGAARDIVVLNAGAAIYVAGRAESLGDGVERAQQVLSDGQALARLNGLVALTQGFETP